MLAQNFKLFYIISLTLVFIVFFGGPNLGKYFEKKTIYVESNIKDSSETKNNIFIQAKTQNRYNFLGIFLINSESWSVIVWRPWLYWICLPGVEHQQKWGWWMATYWSHKSGQCLWFVSRIPDICAMFQLQHIWNQWYSLGN